MSVYRTSGPLVFLSTDDDSRGSHRKTIFQKKLTIDTTRDIPARGREVYTPIKEFSIKTRATPLVCK